MDGIGERNQAETRDFRTAIDPDAHPERAEPAIRVNVEIAVAIEPRVKIRADAQDRSDERSVVGNPHHAAMGMPG